MNRQLYYNARIFSPVDGGTPCAGKDQGRLREYGDGALLVTGERIEEIGSQTAVRSRLTDTDAIEEIDCQGKAIIPGLVDPHTHMCFAEPREEEFELRLAGTPYLDILAAGGGILSSVRAVAAADEESLYQTTLRHARQALTLGTTTIEIKSGYGLDTENELKMLRVIDRIGNETPLDVVPTFLGAHAVPSRFRDDPDGFITELIGETLPAVATQGIARSCDIFCEKGVFSIAHSRTLLSAAKMLGMKVKMHADEVHDLGGARLAAELGAVSADHLLAASESSIEAMAAAGVIATLLPATAYSLRKPYANARMMIEKGVPVALASDCNPGSSFTESMQFVIGLAVMHMQMTPAEALVAATLNSAYAIGMEKMVGSLDPGKQADFLVVDGLGPAIFAYHAGVSSVAAVYKKGVKIC